MAPLKRSRSEVLWAAWSPVAVATLALVWIVPVAPGSDLTDPSQWGIVAYLGSVVWLLARDATGRSYPRRLLALFLAAMPLVYVSAALRYDAPVWWLGIEMVGLLVFAAVAAIGYRKTPWLLPTGIAAHALWDVSHWGEVGFVPDWYTLSCMVVDVAVAGYAAARLAAVEDG